MSVALLLVASVLVPISVSSAAAAPAHAAALESQLTGMRGHAVAVGDVNGDGWVDVFVGTFADRPVEDYQSRGATGPAPDRLLLGGPSGYVIDTTFPTVFGRTSGAAFADLDGDGDLDLVVLRQPRTGERSSAPSVVLRNDGGRFSQAAVLDAQRGLRSVGVLDYDADGRLDLFVVEDRFADGSSVLLRNEGGFVFSDVTASVGLPTSIHGLGVAAADLNGDSRTDLFVGGSNRLFFADGGRFREADSSVFAWPTHGDEDDVAGVAVGDVDRDGRLDIVLGQHYNSTLDSGVATPVRLYLNRGNNALGAPMYEDVTLAAGLEALPTKAPHVELVDVDSDGMLDIVASASTAGGSSPMVLRQTSTSPLRFAAVAPAGSPHYWVAGATFDADRNGELEHLVVEWEPSLPTLLVPSLPDRGASLEVSVAGSVGGIGSVVEVYAAGGLGVPSRLIAAMPIAASVGYGSGSLTRAHLGVGSVSAVDVRVVTANDASIIDRRGVSVPGRLELSSVAAGSPVPAVSSLPTSGVELIRYDRPAYVAAPWSQWGQGTVTSDGRFVSAIGDHLGADGNSYVYVWDPATGRLRLTGDVLSAVAHDPGRWGYGKVHGQMIQIGPRYVYFATYWGNRRGLAYGGSYQGDLLMRLDLDTGAIQSLGVPVPGRGIPSLDSFGSLLYGEAVEPVTDAGTFFVYDTVSRRVVDIETHPLHDGYRGMAVLDDGSVLLATANETLLSYDPRNGELGVHSEVLPGGWLRATTDPAPDGRVFAVTRSPERFVAIETDGSITDLGAAPGYTTSLALFGDEVLFMPGAHGSANEFGAPLMALNTNSGQQRVVVELEGLAQAELGLSLGGTYSIAVDERARRVFVGMNAGTSSDDPWGELVLAVIEIDELDSSIVQPSPWPPGFCGPTVNPPSVPDEASSTGYRVVDAQGTVQSFEVDDHGNSTPAPGESAIAIANTATGDGYWVAHTDGTVQAFGDATDHGDVSSLSLASPIVGMVPLPSGDGYWLAAADGGVFALGGAGFLGSAAAIRLNAPIVGMEATPSGSGYWLVAADGGIFTYGDAVFAGSTGALRLASPVVGMTRSEGGYWLLGGDGGVFSFGSDFHGSVPGTGLCAAGSAVSIAATATGSGYYSLMSDGGVFSFGDAAFRGADPSQVVGAVGIDLVE